MCVLMYIYIYESIGREKYDRVEKILQLRSRKDRSRKFIVCDKWTTFFYLIFLFFVFFYITLTLKKEDANPLSMKCDLQTRIV